MAETKLKTLEAKVLHILEEHKYARDDDRELTLLVHTTYYGIDLDTPYWKVMCNDRIPLQESISRVRRKIQETREDLRGTEAKEKIRMSEQETYLDYARGE